MPTREEDRISRTQITIADIHNLDPSRISSYLNLSISQPPPLNIAYDEDRISLSSLNITYNEDRISLNSADIPILYPRMIISNQDLFTHQENSSNFEVEQLTSEEFIEVARDSSEVAPETIAYYEAVRAFTGNPNWTPRIRNDVPEEDKTELPPASEKDVRTILEKVELLQRQGVNSNDSFEHKTDHAALITRLIDDIVARSSEALPEITSTLKSLKKENVEAEFAQFEKDVKYIREELQSAGSSPEEIENILGLLKEHKETIEYRLKYGPELLELFTSIESKVKVELALADDLVEVPAEAAPEEVPLLHVEQHTTYLE